MFKLSYFGIIKNLVFLIIFSGLLSFSPLIIIAQESNFNTRAELVFIDSSSYVSHMSNTEATLLLLFHNKSIADTCLNYFVVVFQQNIFETQQNLKVGTEYDLEVKVVPNKASKIDEELSGIKKRAVCDRMVLSNPYNDYENYFKIVSLE